MLDLLEIEGYGCIQSAALHLSPLHALIGPNDSGKSTVLRALRTLTLSHGQRDASDAFRCWRFFQNSRKEVQGKTRLFARCKDTGWEIQHGGQASPTTGECAWERQGNSWAPMGRFSAISGETAPEEIQQALAGSLLLRLDPDAMRAPSALIPHGTPLRFTNERGAGLAGIYDAIRDRNLEGYLEINKRFVELFPGTKSLSPRNVSESMKSLGLLLKDGMTYVGAEDMSEGMLYYLAFASLRYIDPVALLLIEEPENGLHPSRIVEVMGVLREISKTTQIILATHSPLVINELQGHEVSVVTRDPEQGTRITLLKDTHNYETRSKIYANGELWVSYANGKDEAPLLGGSDP
jgi:predicted ATPase